MSTEHLDFSWRQQLIRHKPLEGKLLWCWEPFALALVDPTQGTIDNPGNYYVSEHVVVELNQPLIFLKDIEWPPPMSSSRVRDGMSLFLCGEKLGARYLSMRSGDSNDVVGEWVQMVRQTPIPFQPFPAEKF